MPGIIFDIELDEARTNSFNLRWLDKDDNPVDLTGWGAIAEIRSQEGILISRVSHEDDIVLSTPDPLGEDFATEGGKLTVTFPKKDLTNPISRSALWELVLFPTAADPLVNPQTLLRGTALIRKKIASIDV